MRVLTGEYTFEQEVKKSRFIAIAVPVENVQDVPAALRRVTQPDATHNCFAYRVGDQYRFSDDGEPGGSAGRPILAAIEGQGIDCVLVVVVRYFGGTKLGVGGLVRAYGGAAAECLRQAPAKEQIALTLFDLSVSFEFIGAVYTLLDRFPVTKTGERYTDNGLVLTCSIEQREYENFATALGDATRGTGTIVVERILP